MCVSVFVCVCVRARAPCVFLATRRRPCPSGGRNHVGLSHLSVTLARRPRFFDSHPVRWCLIVSRFLSATCRLRLRNGAVVECFSTSPALDRGEPTGFGFWGGTVDGRLIGFFLGFLRFHRVVAGAHNPTNHQARGLRWKSGRHLFAARNRRRVFFLVSAPLPRSAQFC